MNDDSKIYGWCFLWCVFVNCKGKQNWKVCKSKHNKQSKYIFDRWISSTTNDNVDIDWVREILMNILSMSVYCLDKRCFVKYHYVKLWRSVFVCAIFPAPPISPILYPIWPALDISMFMLEKKKINGNGNGKGTSSLSLICVLRVQSYWSALYCDWEFP